MPFHYHSDPGLGNKAKKVKQKHRMTRHLDTDWISSKIKGHGGSWQYDYYNGLATIGHIGSTGKLKIAWYNFLLYLRYLKRRFKNDRNYTGQ